ncbi:hypothetical protein [Tenacibaculum sp. 190130A14a]|uniref:Uncharacterized protein n=1 Tax=Tenacibaculum polynesiense TaxID=3137857 RepID=A0ABP1EUN5_9FLAO
MRDNSSTNCEKIITRKEVLEKLDKYDKYTALTALGNYMILNARRA